MIGPYRSSRKGGKRREGKTNYWWRNQIMTEYRKGIFCLGFIREFICSQEFKTRLIISKSNYFKGVDYVFKIRHRTDV